MTKRQKNNGKNGPVAQQFLSKGFGFDWDPIDTKVSARSVFDDGASALLTSLQLRLREVEKRPQSNSVIVPITSFAPEPYKLRKPILAVVEHHDDNACSASFYDANIHADGETSAEAINNLKSLVLDVFDILTAEPRKNLGAEPRRQLAVLQEFLQRGRKKKSHPNKG